MKEHMNNTAKSISLDNGSTWLSAEEAANEITRRNLWDQVYALMDDETRELVHGRLAPCSDAQFLSAYLAAAADDLVIG